MKKLPGHRSSYACAHRSSAAPVADRDPGWPVPATRPPRAVPDLSTKHEGEGRPAPCSRTFHGVALGRRAAVRPDSPSDVPSETPHSMRLGPPADGHDAIPLENALNSVK